MSAAERPRVVIVGGGFGGLFAAKFLKHAAVDITLVERTNHHLFQPLLYQVATGILSPGAVAPPLREVLKRHDNVKVRLGEVTGFDLDARTVHVEHPASARDLPYDFLIFGIGVGGSYFGHPEFAPHAPTMKTVEDALTLRTRIFGAFEMAALTRDEDERRAWLTFAVVGGGPTGVEVAGQIAELAHRSTGPQLPGVRPEQRHRGALRGRRGDPADLRRPAVRQGDPRAHPARRRRPGQDPGHRRDPRRDRRLQCRR